MYSPPLLFGGHQNWKQREESFKLNSTMKDRNVNADIDDNKSVGVVTRLLWTYWIFCL